MRLSKRVKIAISLIVVASLVLGSVYVVFQQIQSSAESSAVKKVSILKWGPNWEGDEESVVDPSPEQLSNLTYDLFPYMSITIKNPTQHLVFIKIYGYLNMTIIKNGNNVGSFAPDSTETIITSPYSEDVYRLTMPSVYTYLYSDNICVIWGNYSITELYRGTTSPP
jgi:hypothetical protein